MKWFLITLLLLTLFYNSATLTFAQLDNNREPAITILSPQQNATIFGNSVEIVFVVNNFHLVDPKNQITTKEGQGHIALYLDDTSKNYENSVIITKLSPLTLENLEGGSHTLIMELVDNKGDSLKPKISTTLELTTIDKPTNTFKQPDQEEPVNTEQQTVQSGADTLILFTSVIIGSLLFLGGALYLLVLKNKK